MAVASYGVRLFNTICDVLFVPSPASSGSSPAFIPSLDLIKIISRLAEPYEQLVVWQNTLLHSLDLDVYTTISGGGGGGGGGGVPRVNECRLIAERDVDTCKNNFFSCKPFVLDARIITTDQQQNDSTSGTGTGTSGMEDGGGVGTTTALPRRYVVSIAPERSVFRILQSTHDDTSSNEEGSWGRMTGLVASVSIQVMYDRYFTHDAFCVSITPPLKFKPLSSSPEGVQPASFIVGSFFMLDCGMSDNYRSGAAARSQHKSIPSRFDLYAPIHSSPSDLLRGHSIRTELSRPPFERASCAVAFDPAAEAVYMCGGTNGTGSEGSYRPLENARYLVVENRWCTLPPAPKNRRMHAATIYRSHLVMAGGLWSGKQIDSVDAYPLNPPTTASAAAAGADNEWVEWPGLPPQTKTSASRIFCKLVVLDDRLFISWNELTGGGYPPCTAFEVMCLIWDDDDPPTQQQQQQQQTGVASNAPPKSAAQPRKGRWSRIDNFPQTLAAGSKTSEKYLFVV